MKVVIYSISLFVFFLNPGALCAQDKVTVDINIKYQTFKGWGVSISWWANDVGSQFPEDKIDSLCHWLTHPEELNMNVFRYNISGGDAPGHHHMRKDAQIDGYKMAENEPYVWTKDSAQRKILLKINELRTDAVYEAANYSPPYWMTKSGCSAGEESGLDNLKDDYYDDFARYLVDVARHYKEKYGIVFSTISPVNEPFSDWWKANGSQEGCAFSQINQERIIRALHKELKSKRMLRYTGIAAMDANSIDECLNGVKLYKKNAVLPLLKQINVHTYAGTRRSELYEFAKANKIPLWQSESGPLWVNDKGFDNFLLMANRIVTDLRELKPEVWCDWQYAGSGFGGVWSLVGYNKDDKTLEKTKGFFLRKQFSSFIKSGFVFVENDNANILSALSKDKKQMVFVLVNTQNEDKNYILNIPDLKLQNVKLFRTSETENFIEDKSSISVRDNFIQIKSKRKSVISFSVSI